MKMKISTNELLERLAAEHEKATSLPKDAFTVHQYAAIIKKTYHIAQGDLYAKLEAGELKRKKIGKAFYYYEED